MNFSFQLSQSFIRLQQQEPLQFEQQLEIPQKQNEPTTITNPATGELDSFLCLFLARNQAQDLPKPQNSFQERFLDQHIKTIEAILQNSEESIPPSLNQIKASPEEDYIYASLSPPSSISLISFLEVNQLSDQLNDADDLIRDLKKHRDLSELISYFINTYRKEVAMALVILTADIYSCIKNMNFRFLKDQDLLEAARQWVGDNINKYLQRPDSSTFIVIFKQHKTTQAQNLALSNFANRLTIFTATLIMVVAGYFENPYTDGELPVEILSEVDQPKRQSSSSSFGVWPYFSLFSEEEQEEVEVEKKQKMQ